MCNRNKKKRTIIMGQKRNVIWRFNCLLIILVFILQLVGCQRHSTELFKKWNRVESCTLLSVDHSFGGQEWVCSDGTNTYIYQKKGIYRLDGNQVELLCKTSSDVLCMTSDGERIIYGTNDNKLWEYNLTTKENNCINNEMKAWSIVAWDNEVFLFATPKTDNTYCVGDQKLYDYNGGFLIDMDQWAEEYVETITDEQHIKTVSYGQYQIGYIRKCRSIVKNNMEILGNHVSAYNIICCNDTFYDYLVNSYINNEGSAEIGSNFQRNGACDMMKWENCINGNYFFLIQYYDRSGRLLMDNSDMFEHYNPECRAYDCLYRWNIEQGSADILYETKNTGDWIVSYTDDLKYCIVMKKDGLYKINIADDSDEELLWDASGYFDVAVETLNGIVYVFDNTSKIQFITSVDIR